MPRPIAVIDIGSNSIKVLVVNQADDGVRTILFWKTIDARISAGISGVDPQLSDSGMSAGIAAVGELIAAIGTCRPCEVVVVATSAVRDAKNGQEFVARVLEATGLRVRILSGEQEANYIGRGLTCDPALQDLQDFYLFDLGAAVSNVCPFSSGKLSERKVYHLDASV